MNIVPKESNDFFYLQGLWRTPQPRVSLDKKIFLWPPRGLGPPPFNAGQVSCLDLCATLDTWHASLMSYKVDNLKGDMGYLSKSTFLANFVVFTFK